MLVCANGAPAVIEDTLAAALPVLASVTVCAAEVEPTCSLPKDREVGDAVRVALPPPELVPVPVRLTVLVIPPALTVSVPVRVPVAVGLKVTLTVQDAPAAIDEPQLLVCAKSPLAEIDQDVSRMRPWPWRGPGSSYLAQLVSPAITQLRSLYGNARIIQVGCHRFCRSMAADSSFNIAIC